MKLGLGILILFLSYNSYAEKCVKGLSSAWMFNQKQKKIELTQINSSKICHYIKKQLNANLKFNFYNKDKLVFTNLIFWDDITSHDILQEEGKLKSFIEKRNDYKIIKLPFKKEEITRYEVIDLKTSEALGKGKIK